jgi:prepilin-type N-terminal cleavage/methylation domain-containing protein
MVNSRHNNGVTLVEMLVVLGIIMVLATIVVTLTLRVDTQSKENALRNAFALVGSALREYYDAKGQFPPQAERNPANALAHIESMYQELRSVPASRQVLDKLSPGVVKSEGGVADLRSLSDPWGTVMDYVYVPGNTFPELISAGPDKQFGTGDDISNKGMR